MKKMFKAIGKALGNILGEIADKTTDAILNAIEEAFGVRKHKETTLFRDAFAPGKEPPAKGPQQPPEIDYRRPERKAVAINNKETMKLLDAACSKSTDSPEAKKDKAKEQTKEQGMELGISL